MLRQYYEVVEEFDSKKDYGIEMRKQYTECLSVLKKGQKINPLEIARNYLQDTTRECLLEHFSLLHYENSSYFSKIHFKNMFHLMLFGLTFCCLE
jgi:hypothetical protein